MEPVVTLFDVLESTLFPVPCRAGDTLAWCEDGSMQVRCEDATGWRTVRSREVGARHVRRAVDQRIIAPVAWHSEAYAARTGFLLRARAAS